MDLGGGSEGELENPGKAENARESEAGNFHRGRVLPLIEYWKHHGFYMIVCGRIDYHRHRDIYYYLNQLWPLLQRIGSGPYYSNASNTLAKRQCQAAARSGSNKIRESTINTLYTYLINFLNYIKPRSKTTTSNPHAFIHWGAAGRHKVQLVSALLPPTLNHGLPARP